jgi:hypothetical protein
MRARITLVWPAVILLIMLLLGGCGPGKYKPKPDEELYGTWTNEKYGIMTTSNYSPQKEIIDASGYTAYQTISDHNPSQKGPLTIAARWKDSEGNIWYKTFGTASTGDSVLRLQALHKLSKSGTVRECMNFWFLESNPNSYPATIDPARPEYRIYYRGDK